MNNRVFTVALFLLVSGMCALIFQTAWLREFRLIFGASTPASAAVLAIFMGGLGLGNAVLGRRVDRAASPLKLYALFELGISAAAAASPFLLALVRQLYFSLGGQETLGIAGASIVRLLLSTLVIGLPTFLMGGTLPAAARAATSAADRARGSVGWLYGLNTIGAVIGALASTFVLLELLGNRETLWAAGAVNIANALLAWRLAGRFTSTASPPEPAVKSPPHLRADRTAKRQRLAPARQVEAIVGEPDLAGDQVAPRWLIYAAAGLVGFVFLLMELVWYRMLGPILGGTTFTFGVILAVALAGIGLGGVLYPLLFRNRVPSLRDFALTCGWEALAIALPLAIGDRLAVLAAVLRGLAYFGFAGQTAGWVIIALIVIFPAALVSGLQFPLMIALLGQGRREVGKQVGQATAWNTLGAMAGSLAGGFGLLSILSVPGAWTASVLALAALSLATLAIDFRAQRLAVQTLYPLAIVFLAGLCLSFLGPTAAWRHSGIGAGRARMPELTQDALHYWQNFTRRSILWEADGHESSVAIAAGNGVSFLVNGKSDGNALSDAPTQIMFPLVGAMIHARPQRSLVIGLGTGESAGWLAALPTMEHVDVVELEPAIAAVAEVCGPLNHDVLRHPKVRLVFNDGREVLQTTRSHYDLIASEPSNPYRAGVANLYTREFYESVRARLAPQGLFIQWLQGYEIDPLTVRAVICTLRSVFPHIEIWTTKPTDLVLVCSSDPFDYDLDRLRERVSEPVFRDALRIGWQTLTVEGVLSHFVANEHYANHVATQDRAWINTDNHNRLEYSFGRTVGRSLGFSVQRLRDEASQRNVHRPLRIGAQVDWETVEDRRIASYAALGEVPLSAARFTGERAIRAQALAEIVTRAPPHLAIATWHKQTRPPEDLIEVSLLAFAYAATGDPRAEPLVDQVRQTNPLDAELLMAILAAEQKRPAEAVRLLDSACRQLSAEVAPLGFLEGVIQRIVKLAESDRQHAPALFHALRKPFAVHQQEQLRLNSRLLIAKQIDDAALVEAMAEFEPWVPWDHAFLQTRWQVYDRTGNPLSQRARRELMEFLRQTTDPFVLQPDDNRAKSGA